MKKTVAAACIAAILTGCATTEKTETAATADWADGALQNAREQSFRFS